MRADTNEPKPNMSLQFEHLICGYGDTAVLRDVSGQVQAGQVLAVVGRNGVGKSTLLKSLAGALPLMGGTLCWRGQRLDEQPLHKRLALGMAYMPQTEAVFGELSVADNLWLHLNERKSQRYAALFADFPLLERRGRQRAGSLSGGERKILSFVRTLGLQAALTLLDEPSEGVQPENIARMAGHITRSKDTGTSFIVVEQNLEFVLAIADTLIALDQGRIVLSGRCADLERAQIERHLML